jgi:crotonobetainyl-CoA:carnitine CoA-transferase CaiB-like acyl-CoA transferase
VPAGPVLEAHTVKNLAQIVHRQFYECIRHPITGLNTHSTLPIRFSRMDLPIHRRPPPLLGQHNREIFCDVLGLTNGELEALELRRIISDRVLTQKAD